MAKPEVRAAGKTSLLSRIRHATFDIHASLGIASCVIVLCALSFCGWDSKFESRPASPGRVDFSREPQTARKSRRSTFRGSGDRELVYRKARAPVRSDVRVSGERVRLEPTPGAPRNSRDYRTRLSPSTARTAEGRPSAAAARLLEKLRGSDRSTVESLKRRAPFLAESDEEIDWQPIFRGIDHVRVHARSPRLMEGQALRIDLREPGIEFLTTPSNGRVAR